MADCLSLKKSNCKNCYKCIRHCPVKSIRFSGDQAIIIGDDCILCGQCFVVCPQDAKEIVDETEKTKVFLQGDEPVIASIAPSFVANYDGMGIGALRKALQKLGFYDVEETALGATIVKNQYDEMLLSGNHDILISSCCHSVNLLIQKYYPRQLPYLADVVSPMQAHCIDIKHRYPNAKTVFIGPCVAKKDEAGLDNEIVDAVLTFEELSNWLEEENIDLEHIVDTTKESKARLFPTTGGILNTMDRKASDYTYLAIDGVDNCIAALQDIEQGKLDKCFIEMSACTGSCIGGPVMEKYHSTPVRDYIRVTNYAGDEDFVVENLSDIDKRKFFNHIDTKPDEVSEKKILTTLRQMGKIKPEDELNCGSCGYDTCREKAAAINQGKADLSMCLPFLKDKAESFSNNIINNSPNGILILNESLEIQDINKAALKLLNLNSASNVKGEPVVRILDPRPFRDAKQENRTIHNKQVYLTEYDKYVEQTILYDKEYHVVLCIMQNITDEVNAKKAKDIISKQTAEVADKVVDKQMRIVQEIASLLGETTAETKIALTKLKESISDE